MTTKTVTLCCRYFYLFSSK